MEKADSIADRTLEMKAMDPNDPEPAAAASATVREPLTASGMSADPRLMFENGGGNLESRIPEGMSRKRPSPSLDPLMRARISRGAKWGALLAILLFIAWCPAYFWQPNDSGNRLIYFLSLVTTATVFASVIATALPRLLLPQAFGRWHEASEALRDWLLVGLLTGLIYFAMIQVATIMHIPAAETPADWIRFRLPLLLGASLIGVPIARGMAIRRDGVLGDGVGNVIWQSVLQIALLGALERPIENALGKLFNTVSGMTIIFGGAGAICILISFSIVIWAAGADASLSTIRRRRGGTGFDDGSGPVNLTLTVIGGRESGKTVLLAAAFYEWSTQNIGHLRITPAVDAVASDSGATNIENLEDVARELYVNNQFPVGTVSTQNLPFNLSFGQETIARFTFLDYPGGAIAGRVADSGVVQRFWERVEDTDGILLIADMSYVRRSHKDADWLEVRNAYRTVMQRLVDRNGKRRVVPVALVLTKCDEFVDPNTGHIDLTALQAGLKEFQYDELEAEWRQLNAHSGPGFAEFSTWITSAITYSQPQFDRDGRPDYSKPFQIAPPPPNITPTGCASPLLWMTAKVMRWNVTAFYDISSFLLGSTPRVRKRVESILEMEKIAEQRAGRA